MAATWEEPAYTPTLNEKTLKALSPALSNAILVTIDQAATAAVASIIDLAPSRKGGLLKNFNSVPHFSVYR